ncbi:TonB-dependent receptor domain-containing protein [Haliangium sp.]|uniref:TonB-dependent receptor n=1 Tax=Haliangium sp. TaxID=2663208 RepID=UPI003D0F6F6B
MSLVFVMCMAVAFGQARSAGGVRGTIVDSQSGEPIAGAIVEVRSSSLQGVQSDTTDAVGGYFIDNLPPGMYRVVVYHLNTEFSRGNVVVQLGKTIVVNLEIDSQLEQGEVIEIEGRTPVIDQGSTKTGQTITEEYTRNVPSGVTFGEVVGSVGGAQDDNYGTSIGGATSAENVYVIEGLNTTDPAFGLQSSNLPNEFVGEAEIITGGYNAEYGRSTGGVVNILTKSGSNEFHGSVFTYFTPGALRANEVGIQEVGSAIEGQDELDYDLTVGAEAGGPIIEDRLWFHAGISPSFQQNTLHRIVQSQIDEDGDGQPDTNPDGSVRLREVGRGDYEHGASTVFFTSKLSGAVSPEHQGWVSFFGNPSSSENLQSVTASEVASRLRLEKGAWDVSGNWVSKFNDNKTQIGATVGWHRNRDRQFAALSGGDESGFTNTLPRSLADYGQYERDQVPAACVDGGASDPYPDIVNCPVPGYRFGGVGFREVQTMDRLAVTLAGTQRLQGLGNHIIKVGLDSEFQTYRHLSYFTGGQRYRLRRSSSLGEIWQIDRFYNINPDGSEMCVVQPGQPAVPCIYRNTGHATTTDTRNIGAYAQDSWQLLPNLVLNFGLRWEQQRAGAAEEVVGVTSPITGDVIDDVAFTISDMIAPRLGLIFDPTREGRAKLFGHWGRFYESVPMDINSRAFGGEVFNRSTIVAAECPAELGPNNTDQCGVDKAIGRAYLGGGEMQPAPGLGGQYVDEVILGGEYELWDQLKVGATYIRRDLGRAIENMSSDGSTSFVIGNPGEVDNEAIEDLRRQGRTEEANLFASVANFDRPTRLYEAVQFSLEKRFQRNLMIVGTYTLSRLEGNFPGLFSTETGQLDPNLTAMYNLPELVANRTGPLAGDRRHIVKLDGYYVLDLARLGYVVIGGGIRGTSGMPHNYLGGHPIYGIDETYVLPRGTGGRSPLVSRFDMRLQYARDFGRNLRMEVFVDVINVFNQQQELGVDETYTLDEVYPIVGGDDDDLRHLKVLSANASPSVNPNFRNTSSRQAPLAGRFGLRVSF